MNKPQPSENNFMIYLQDLQSLTAISSVLSIVQTFFYHSTKQIAPYTLDKEGLSGRIT